MSAFQNSKDIFLWADGYWCYREDFQAQPRQSYTYRLVLENTHQWLGLTGAEPYTRPERYAVPPSRNNPQSPTQLRRQHS